MALFLVRMDVDIPATLDSDARSYAIAREKEYSRDLQERGKWLHVWRVVGKYSNVSVFDVDSTDELHELLLGLPLFPYMAIEVTPLARHANSISSQL